MDKKEALIRSLIELRSAQNDASAALSIVVNQGARAAKGQGTTPALADIRSYEKAMASAKIHAAQAELVLLEYALPHMPVDSMEYAMFMR